MNQEIRYDGSGSAYKQFRLCISNDTLVEAIEQYQRQTGLEEREIAHKAIVGFLEEEELIQVD